MKLLISMAIVMAKHIHDTSGLEIMVDKWIPHGVPDEDRERFTSKFLKLANKTKGLIEPVLHPIVMGHPKYDTATSG